MNGDGAQRMAMVQGLHNLASFIILHPDLPLPSVQVNAHAHGSDEQARAEVDRTAAVLGQPAAWARGTRTHYETSRDFGGGVVYSAVAITQAHMAAYDEYSKNYPRGVGGAA